MNKKVNKFIPLFAILIMLALSTVTSKEADARQLYFGNWDMHVGGCWLAEPLNCVGCGLAGCLPGIL